MSYNALMEVLNPVMVICYGSLWRIFGLSIGKDVTDVADQKALANKLC